MGVEELFVIRADGLDRAGSISNVPWSASVLAGLVYLEQPDSILELGTYLGDTTKILRESAPSSASVTSVEVSETRHHHASEQYSDLDIEFVCQNSLEFLSETNESYDFVLVDDKHEIDHVEQELDRLWDLLEPRSLMVLHDVIGAWGLDALVYERGGACINLPIPAGGHPSGGFGLIRR